MGNNKSQLQIRVGRDVMLPSIKPYMYVLKSFMQLLDQGKWGRKKCKECRVWVAMEAKVKIRFLDLEELVLITTMMTMKEPEEWAWVVEVETSSPCL